MEKIKRAILFHTKSMQQILAFLLGSSFIYRLHTLDWWKEYRWDAGDYWYGMALSYNLDKFSIYNYNNPLRGYLYPLMAYALHKLAYIGIGAERLNFFIATSILYTICFIISISIPVKFRLFSLTNYCFYLYDGSCFDNCCRFASDNFF